MIVTVDSSFLVSLYGNDVNTGIARAWLVVHAPQLILTDVVRFETENALRLAVYRGMLTEAELSRSLFEIESDLQLGISRIVEISGAALWAECRRMSASQTAVLGCRSYDIAHVAAARLLAVDVFLSFDNRQRQLATAVGPTVAPG